MVVGIPRERKVDEHRVALQPRHVSALAHEEHRVLVERDAGVKAGFPDAAYAAAGADIVEQDELYRDAELIVKVKCPCPDEYGCFNERHTLFAYLHFDECIPAPRIKSIVNTGVFAIAYEWVEVNGRYPLLEPMSEITGAVAAFKTLELLMKHKGKLPVRGHAERPRAMILGGGRIGLNAASTLTKNGFSITLVDKHPETLRDRYEEYVSSAAWMEAAPTITAIRFDEQQPEAGVRAIREALPATDILICAAVRRPTLPPDRCQFLIDRSALALMEPNSIICDATACDEDLIETCLSTETLEVTSIVDGIVHYCCDHLPAYIPQTASILLSEATFPYVRLLARGAESAVAGNASLRSGVMCYRGHLTHERSATKKGLPWQNLSDLLPAAAGYGYGY